VTNAASVAAFVAEVDRRFGGVHILVNNAGIFASLALKPFAEIDSAEWDRVMAVNVRGSFECAKAVLPVMRRQRYGKIINIASGTVFKGSPLLLHYVASKGAVVAMTRAMAREVGDDGIRVNCLAPGWIATDGPRQYWESLTPEQRAERGVPSRLLTPDQIADAVFTLATDETLAGRVMLWWSDDAPRLIQWGDRGYAVYEDVLKLET